MSKWLTRLRKDLLRSGSLTELSLHLAKHSTPSKDPETWQLDIRAILEEDRKPDSDFLLAVDQWISQRNFSERDQSSSVKTSHSEDQLDLL